VYLEALFLSVDCYIINVAANNSVQASGYQAAEIFSYEFWVYLTFIILPVIYAIIFYYTRCKMKVHYCCWWF